MQPHQTTNPQPHPTGSTRTYRINLPWPRPPLTENQRLGWAAKARLTKQIRRDTYWLVRAAKIPPSEHCDVTLYWAPSKRRKRDSENPNPTYKACCDGIVDAGVIKDDVPELMAKHVTVILPPQQHGAMWLEITITQQQEHNNQLRQSGAAKNLTRGKA